MDVEFVSCLPREIIEFRTQIAKELIEIRKELNLCLDCLNHLVWIVDSWIIESARNQILENFNNSLNELKERPWYEDAERRHRFEAQNFVRAKKQLKHICVSQRMLFE